MNKNLEQIIKHPIKTMAITGAGIFLLSNVANAQTFIKDGTITNPITAQPVEGIKITMPIFDGATPIDTIGPLYTDNQGKYTTSITDVEDEKQTETTDAIKYYTNRIETNLGENTFILYTILGQKVIETQENNNITPKINNLASGVYPIDIITKDFIYKNILNIQEGKIVGAGKKTIKINKTKNTLEKITENLILTRDFEDTNGQYHSYIRGVIDPTYYENTTFNLTLPPIIPLQTPFNDPEVPYQIDNLIDLWKYMSRIQGTDDYVLFAKTLYPIGIFTDSSNTPQTWKQYVNNATSIVKDSLGIPADSILKINNEYTEPDYNLGYSTVNITYMDSTTFKNVVGDNLYAGGSFIFDNTNIAFTGFDIYLNTDKIINPIDAQKYILRLIQNYITQSIWPINNPNYLGKTDNVKGPGTRTTYNTDEKTQIKMIRNMTPNVWINRFFNPGTLYKPETPKGYERKGQLLIPKEQIINVDDTMYKQMRKELENKSLK